MEFQLELARPRDREPPSPRPLPQTLTREGRPVWEPPIFNYSHLIGEEYEKKREAIFKYFDGDVVRTTEVLDTEEALQLLTLYLDWVEGNELYPGWHRDYSKPGNPELWHSNLPECFKDRKVHSAHNAFFEDLKDRVIPRDRNEVAIDHSLNHLRLERMKDGIYTVINTAPNWGKNKIDRDERNRQVEIMMQQSERKDGNLSPWFALHFAREIHGDFASLARDYPQYQHLAHLNHCRPCDSHYRKTRNDRNQHLPLERVCGQPETPSALKSTGNPYEQNKASVEVSDDSSTSQSPDEAPPQKELTISDSAPDPSTPVLTSHQTTQHTDEAVLPRTTDTTTPLLSSDENTQPATNERSDTPPEEVVDITLDLLSLW